MRNENDVFEKWTPLEGVDQVYDVDDVKWDADGLTLTLLPDDLSHERRSAHILKLTWAEVVSYQLSRETFRADWRIAEPAAAWTFHVSRDSAYLRSHREANSLLPPDTLHFALVGTNWIADILATAYPTAKLEEKTVRHIIFDLDGTLIDSMPVWRGVGADFLRKQGVPVPENLIEIIKSQTLWQTAAYFRQELGIPMTEEAIVAEIIRTVQDAYRHTIPLKPCVWEYLEEQRRQGAQMCILTASESDYIRPALERLGIADYFNAVLTCTELGEYKEDGSAYLTAMRLLGGTAADTIVFEDALYAVKGAKNVGLPVVAVLDASVRDEADLEKIRSLADRVIVSYAELLAE